MAYLGITPMKNRNAVLSDLREQLCFAVQLRDRRYLALLVCVAAVLFLAGRAEATSPSLQAVATVPQEAQTVVNRFIRSQQSRARGSEYKEGRKIVTGDLDGDGNPDVAVLYTLEGAHGGSNDYNQYLAVFLNVNGKYAYKGQRRVGGRFERNMDLKSIEGGKILVDTMEYLPSDPSCCPSKKGSAQFALTGGRLIETKAQQNK